jgi:PKD repeat protein
MKIATLGLVFLATLVSVSAFNLYVKDWYPKTNHYVFVCDAPSSTYDWFYGDGEKQINITNGDTYHIYPDAGSYTVKCTARDLGESATLSVAVLTDAAETSEEGTQETPEQRKLRHSRGGYLLVVDGVPYLSQNVWEVSMREAYLNSNASNITNLTVSVPALSASSWLTMNNNHGDRVYSVPFAVPQQYVIKGVAQPVELYFSTTYEAISKSKEN